MRKYLLTAIVLLSAFFSNAQGSKDFQLTEAESKSVMNSPEVQQLLKLQNEFHNKVVGAVDQGKEIGTIKSAFYSAVKDGNAAEFYTLVFGGVENGEAFTKKLQAANRQFLDKNSFAEKQKDAFCPKCQTAPLEGLANYFNNFQKVKPVTVLTQPESPNVPPCGSYWNQVRLIACSAICGATTLGVGAVACIWSCWCTYCHKNSSVASAICPD